MREIFPEVEMNEKRYATVIAYLERYNEVLEKDIAQASGENALEDLIAAHDTIIEAIAALHVGDTEPARAWLMIHGTSLSLLNSGFLRKPSDESVRDREVVQAMVDLLDQPAN